MPGYGPWSVKDGIVHVEPPEPVLKGIVTLRLHLDRANTENGALRVIPKSHKMGRVPSRTLLEVVENSEAVDCIAEPGDVLLMSPLIFHSSRKSKQAARRRIIHIEYCAARLPEPMDWFERPGAARGLS